MRRSNNLQPSLFDPLAELQPQRAPNVASIRKHLLAALRRARNAEIMPWYKPEAEDWEQRFPALTAHLPAEEGEILRADFAKELARLKSKRVG